MSRTDEIVVRTCIIKGAFAELRAACVRRSGSLTVFDGPQSPSASRRFDAIARTLPLGGVAIEAEPNERGERYVWLEEVWVNRLDAMRGPGEDYSA